MIKKTLILSSFILLTLSAYSQSQRGFFGLSNQFFKTNIQNGLVDYEKIKQTPKELENLTTIIKTISIENWTDAEKKAFWINAYNLTVIQSIIDNYPIVSPNDVSDFFDAKKHLVAGKTITINDIENKELRAVYKDPRLHFLLVCGAVSCPSISNFAYLPNGLNQQLESKTKKTLNDNDFIRVDDDKKEVAISHIFDWYQQDFGQNKKEVISYINNYRKNQIPTDYSIKYYNYNWALNTIKLEKRTHQTVQELPKAPSLQNYTPSVLLKKGQVEVKSFNGLYTDNSGFNQNRQNIASGRRQSYFTGFIQTLYGLSPQINIGIDAQIKSVRLDASNSSPFKLFTFEKRSKTTRTALSYIGPNTILTIR